MAVRGSSNQDGDPYGDNDYYLEDGESSSFYSSDIRRSEVHPDTYEFIFSFMEQINSLPEDDAQERQRKDELSRLYNFYYYYSERLYQNSRWPTVEEISRSLLTNMEGLQISVFKRLYSELYMRHALELSESKSPSSYFSYSDYCDSMEVYLGLFNLLLNEQIGEPLNLDLPLQWIWDIIAGFLKHHQSFLIWRSQVKMRTIKERQLLRDSDNLWTVELVLNALNTLIRYSHINEQLEAYHKTRNPDAAKEAGGKYGRQPLYRNLGYFSLFGLLELHTQLGDYHEGLLSVRNIRITHQTLTRMTIPLSAITLVYNAGFCYFMMRRYLDVIRVFSEITQLAHSWSLEQSTPPGDQLMKQQVDKIVHKCLIMLAIITPLIPHNFDDKTSKSLSRLKTINEAIFKFRVEQLRETFYQCSPHFLPIFSPNYDNHVDQSEVCIEHQCEVFMADFIPQMFIPRVKSYLEFYASLPLTKLAEFLASEYSNFSEADAEKYFVPNRVDRLRSFLMCYKHKMYSPVWVGESPLEGSHRCANDLEFYLDGDMIHIVEKKVREQTYEELFLDEILKLRELKSQLIKPQTGVPLQGQY